MPKIFQLSPHEAQKIAAGQVVERPANIVKELLENSIDAGASHIQIIIKDGGKELIRIIDNGSGMDAIDAIACFKQHATSKITSVDELPSLTTFGFRGEALASIAAVSKVTLLTKQAGMMEGSLVTAQEGTFERQDAACPIGTDISVAHLFYNVPARAKFIKTKETETRHIVQTIKAMALAYPHLHITLTVDDMLLLNCPAQDDLIGRYAQLWDNATAQHMLPISAINSQKRVSLTGVISDHQWLRYDRSGIFFLVNNRWVTNSGLGRALLKGYNNVLPPGRYPMATVNIIINPALIDINAHPRKEEIIFANPRLVEQLIQEAVCAALEKNLSRQLKKVVTIHQSVAAPSSFAFTPASLSAVDHIPPAIDFTKTISLPPAIEPLQMQQHMPLATEMVTTPAVMPILETAHEPYTIVGQLHKTYIILEKDDGLYLVDQHAAHERILYEIFSNRFAKIPTINLMFPQLIAVDPASIGIIESIIPLLAEHGIVLEPFGKDQLVIQSTPVHLKDASIKEIIEQLIGWIKEEQAVNQQEMMQLLHKKLRAQMACKAAVKAGDSLSHDQMQELIDDLEKTDNRFSCPHGRPTGWLISKAEIEKKFQRRK